MTIEQSTNWDKYSQLDADERERLLSASFPFSEGFPTDPAGETYMIMTSSGEMFEAIVNGTGDQRIWIPEGHNTLRESAVAGWRKKMELLLVED